MKKVMVIIALALMVLLACEQEMQVSSEVTTKVSGQDVNVQADEGSEDQGAQNIKVSKMSVPNETENETQDERLEVVACTHNSECDDACIDGTCAALSQLHQCLGTCNYVSAVIETSDGETYEYSPMKQGYTAAGAINWQIVKTPNHCLDEEVIVPVLITEQKLGKVIGEYYITLTKGETSGQINHPGIPDLNFRLTLKDVETFCSSS